MITLRANTIYKYLFGAAFLTLISLAMHGLFWGTISILSLCLLPGLLILLMLDHFQTSFLEWLVYSLGLSLLFDMLLGLTINQLVPAISHNTHPLSQSVLAPIFGVVIMVLFIASWLRNAPHEIELPFAPFTGHGLAAGAGFALLPIMSIFGALSLNNGGSNTFTMLMYGLIGVTAVALVIWRHQVANWVWPWATFTMALALLWSTSLRGYYITGHDVQLEYYVFRLTDSVQRWAMSHLQDPYNACLSITILPTVLKELTGFSGIVLYKVWYQIWFAITTTSVWLLARKFTSRLNAFIAAFIFITFPTFTMDMPMLNRQEVAFMYFTLLLLVLFTPKVASNTRKILYVALATGTVLAHYSTTFVAAAVLLGAYIWQSPVIYQRLQAHKANGLQFRRYHGVTIGVLAAIFCGVIFWTGIYTKTGGNISKTIAKAAQQLPTVLSSKNQSDVSQYTVLSKSSWTPQALVDNYSLSHHNAALSTAQSGGGLYQNYWEYPLEDVAQPTLPVTNLGNIIGHFGISASTLNALAKQGYALALQGLLVLTSAIAIIFRKRLRLSHEFVALAPAALAFLVLQTVLTVIDYGLLRMIQQDLIFLVVPLVLGCFELMKWIGLKSLYARQIILVSALSAFFLAISGFMGELTGGAVAQLPLSNSGFYYDAYYTNSEDMTTFSWLSANYPAGAPINSDSFLRMKIMSNTGITTVDGITPGELSQNSYVVLGGINVTQDRVAFYSSINGDLLFYHYPVAFLDSNKNLIYATDSTRIYQ